MTSSILLLFFTFFHTYCVVIPFLCIIPFFSVYKKIRLNYDNGQYKIKRKPKSLIVSTPGGIHGFYLLGVSSYIKENYNLTNFIYTGASAGAWNSLYLSFTGNNTEFINSLLYNDIHNVSSMYELEQTLKQTILQKYTKNDFQIDRINIGVTILRKWLNFKLVIYNDFETLEDVLNCCIASSHIPFITGGLIHRYRGRVTFDGGFFKYPYLNTSVPVLTISPSMWNNTFNSNMNVQNYMYSNDLRFNLTSLYLQGYHDSERNKKYLDDVLL